MSSTGYLIWFIVTTLCVVALLVVGMLMATGVGFHRHKEGDGESRGQRPPL